MGLFLHNLDFSSVDQLPSGTFTDLSGLCLDDSAPLGAGTESERQGFKSYLVGVDNLSGCR